MHALVVGSTGFLGTHVRRGLEARGWRVATVDRATTPDPVRATAACRADVVVNCAGATAGTRAALHRANADLAVGLAAAVAAAGRGTRLVHLGSAAEYGAGDGTRACTEQDVPAPVTDYGRSKLAGTLGVLLALPAAVVLRPTTVVGPGSRGLLAALCAQAAVAGPDGTVRVGPLDAARDLVDVADVVAAVAAAAAGPCPGGVLNVGTGRAVPLTHVVETFRAVTGFRGTVRTDAASPSPSASVVGQRSDVTRIARVLGWRPAVPLATSVRVMWEHAAAGA